MFDLSPLAFLVDYGLPVVVGFLVIVVFCSVIGLLCYVHYKHPKILLTLFGSFALLAASFIIGKIILWVMNQG